MSVVIPIQDELLRCRVATCSSSSSSN
eukprot:COSAG06_NODE_35522_length_459_cov_0.836111_1_plen_26_part_01